MLPSAPGVAVMTNWFGATTAALSTAGPFSTQFVPLIWPAMLFRNGRGIRALGQRCSRGAIRTRHRNWPATPAFTVMRISLLYWPPTVAVQFGRKR